MNMQDNVLQFIGSFLSGVPSLRAEWSLEISEFGIYPRTYTLFWVGRKDDTENKAAFVNMHRLLEQLNCPRDILDFQRKVSTYSSCQGVGVPLGSGSKKRCLYLFYTDKITREEKVEAYKWGDDQNEFASYSVHFFSDRLVVGLPVHDRFLKVFNGFLATPRLIRGSGCWIKYQDRRIREIYVTFPWHPEVRTIVPQIEDTFPEICSDDLLMYNDLNFRHVGFSSSFVAQPVITLYFCAPLTGKWPEDFEDFRDKVSVEGKLLQEKLIAHS